MTYFISFFTKNSNEPSPCTATICPCGESICQIRLDFMNFNIAGPEDGNDGVIGNILNGSPTAQGGGVPVTDATRCVKESFSVSNHKGGSSPPVICGTNDGQHLYVDSSPQCNDLTFILDGMSGNSQWMIRVSQYKCSYENLAPSGCDQWYFGSDTGSVSTFNFEGGLHLANQDQRICIRREVNTCRLCWTTLDQADFQVSGPGDMALTDDDICCDYDFNLALGFDCVVIPTALTKDGSKQLNANVFCGASKGLAAIGSVTAQNPGIINPNKLPDQTICTQSTPFSISFISDNYEFEDETTKSPRGFRLLYNLEKCP